jgi:ribosomal protein L11 methylase PrmA
MRLGLSGRQHLPALFLNNSRVAYPLYAYGFLWRFEASQFVLTPYAENVLCELRCGFYKPPFSLKGKTVLDLGACCGESAWYFLKVLGAQKVYCVECDSQNIGILRHNRDISKLNFDVIPERFQIKHLKLPFDFLKCDIEGGEVLLADYLESNRLSVPCVLEVHSEALRERFEGLGFRVAKTFVGPSWTCYLMDNFTRK